MPVYEYRCTQCNKEFEYQQRMADPAKTVCEACGGALERLISRTAFQLKGGGWYKDLYASQKPASDTATSEAKPASDSTPSTSETTTPAKPAETPKPSTGSGTGTGSGTP